MMPIVFLHGWGQSARIWHGQKGTFPDALFLNLPGHGGASDAVDWLAAIVKQLPETPCLLVGWSLGGMLALQLAAQYPDRVAGLALVATTPRFRNDASWPHGCSDEVFDGFAEGVNAQSAKVLGRFFALMLHGDSLPRSEFNQLVRASIDRDQPPTSDGLRRGLELLATLDLRRMVTHIPQPALVLHGDADAIIPAAAGHWLADSLQQAHWQTLQGGHAPFLTQPAIFNSILEEWCQNISTDA